MEINVKEYIVAIRHDTGIARIRTAALTAKGARLLVITTEACPGQAIISVVEIVKNKSKVHDNTKA